MAQPLEIAALELSALYQATPALGLLRSLEVLPPCRRQLDPVATTASSRDILH
ncbi:MAG: hypothetical protein RMM98_16320 [Acidobacteriota bacterium]|nr:hypothetical protein [Blastocatellia bacterium]MDW8241169.1 hypothetical protein [Acidobacteriota bacterium]